MIEVDDAKTIIFGYEYRTAGPWGVEAAVGIPPKHKTYGRGVLEPFGQVSTVKQVSPTLFLNYHFGPMAGGIEPFIGAGLNFTRFTGARSTVAGNLASGGPTQIELKDSWGLAAHAGASMPLAPKLNLIAAIAAADVKSDLTATTSTAAGNVVRTTRINFRPVVYMMMVSYTF